MFGLVFVPVNTEDEKLKLLATADDLPDVFSLNYADPFITMVREDGLIREIPEAILNKYPFSKQLMHQGDFTNALIKATGKYWFYPKFNDVDQTSEPVWHVIRYRKDWLANVGIEKEPATLDEFEEMLRRFTFNDPTGRGETTFGLSGWLYSPLFYPFVDYEQWVYEDGQWIQGWYSKGAREGLIWLNKMYKEGIIDPEFSGGDPRQLFMEDKIGAYLSRWDDWGVNRQIVTDFGSAQIERGTITENIQALDLVGWLPPLKKDAGSPALWGSSSNDQYPIAYSKRVDDNKLDRLLSVAEWMNAPGEGRITSSFGFKDIDYTLNGETLTIIMPEDGSQLYEKYPCMHIGNCLARWGASVEGTMGMVVLNKPYPPEVYATVRERKAAQAACVRPFDPAVSGAVTPAMEGLQDGDWEDIFMSIVSTSGDPGAEFDAYIQRLKDIYGLQKVWDEVNALFGPPSW